MVPGERILRGSKFNVTYPLSAAMMLMSSIDIKRFELARLFIVRFISEKRVHGASPSDSEACRPLHVT